MPRTIEKTVFTYSELSEAAKEKARNWYRDDGGDNFRFAAEFVLEDAENMARVMGIEIAHEKHGAKIYYSGFSSQGDGASFVGSYRYAKGASKKIREKAPQDAELHRIADQLQNIQSRHFYRIGATMSQGAGSNHYSHSHTMAVDVFDRQDDKDFSDCEDELSQLMRDFADWIYSQLEKEYDWINEDAQVEENIIANDYEFDEEGNIA